MVELGSYTPTSTHLVVGAAFSMHGMGEFVAFFFFGGLVSVIITSLIVLCGALSSYSPSLTSLLRLLVGGIRALHVCPFGCASTGGQ
jgi:hypothetical protein